MSLGGGEDSLKPLLAGKQRLPLFFLLLPASNHGEVRFVTSDLWEKPNAINVSVESKQKTKRAFGPHRQTGHVEWGGNKTPIRGSYSEVYSCILHTTYTHEANPPPPPQPMMHCFLPILSRFDWQFCNYGIRRNNETAARSDNCFFGRSPPKMCCQLSAGCLLYQLLLHASGDVSTDWLISNSS